MEVIDGQSQGRRSWIATDMYESGAGSVGVVIEDIPIDPPIQSPHHCCHCCCHCTYRIPTLRELYQRDKRLLRAIVVITIVLNLPGAGKYVLYPFMIFSTWIHETFHGLAGERGEIYTWNRQILFSHHESPILIMIFIDFNYSYIHWGIDCMVEYLSRWLRLG